METMREHVVDYTAGAYRAAASVGWYTRIFLSPACRCTEKSSHMAPYRCAGRGCDPLSAFFDDGASPWLRQKTCVKGGYLNL